MIVIYCPKCGIPNDDNAERCSRCGSLLREETAETTANENNSIPPMQEKPYEQYQGSQNQEATQAPPPPYDPYPPYQQPYVAEQPPQPPYQQPYQPPYGGMPFSPFGNVQLQPYSNTLAVVSLVLSIICCNIVPGLVLSVIAMTQGSKYNTASSIGNYYDANNATKLSKILSWVSIGISAITIIIYIFAFVMAFNSYDSGYYNYYY